MPGSLKKKGANVQTITYDKETESLIDEEGKVVGRYDKEKGVLEFVEEPDEAEGD